MRDELNAITPRLRRYARALVCGDAAPSEVADALVHAALMRALGSRTLGGAADWPIRLFATVTQLHRDLAPQDRLKVAAVGGGGAPGTARGLAARGGNRLSTAIMALAIEEREALLLVALEQFDHASAARILRIARPVLLERLTRARIQLGAIGGAIAAPEPVRTLSSAPTRVPYLRLVVG